MTNPWTALDAAVGQKKLSLDHTVSTDVENASKPYQASLQALLGDSLDDTTGYFGKDARNTLAPLMETAFNGLGKAMTDYLKAQSAQAEGLVKTAREAATTIQTNT